MEEYIKILLEQVRFEKAHKAIGDEIRAHIEDQAEANISEGMDKETAEKKAVEDMGDPVETGIALDKVHRPQMAWGVIVAVLAVAIVGAIFQFLLRNDQVLIKDGQYYNPDRNYIVNNFFSYTIMGICLMLLFYFLDFTVIAKYSRIIGIVWASGYLITSLPDVLLINTGVLTFKQTPFGIDILNEIAWRLSDKMLILVPLYAGILYEYKERKKTFSKALLWIFIPVFYIYFGDYLIRGDATIIAICMLAELTVAIMKGWIKLQKKVLVHLYGGFIIITSLSYGRMFKCYGDSVQEEILKEVVDSIYLFGSGIYYGHDGFQKPSSCFIDRPFGTYFLTYISSTYGAFWGIVIIAIVVGIIVLGFMNLFKSKNQLGHVMGMGCMMWLAVNTIVNVFTAFGVFPEWFFVGAFLPFVSTDNSDSLIYAYAALGILLSIYKYKDAYSQDVEIERFGIRNLLKDLNL